MSKIQRAREELYKICKDQSKFKMCIPAQNDDTDNIFIEAFNHAETLEKAIAILGRSNSYYKKDAWCERALGCRDWCRVKDTEQIEDINGVEWSTGGKTAREHEKQVKELLGEKEYERILASDNP